jgi:heat shock protein HtpX
VKRAGYDRDLGLSLRMVVATIFLLALYAPLLTWLALALGATASSFSWLIIAAVAIGLPLTVADLAERAVLATVSARIVDERVAPWLHEAVARLCAAAELPKPRIALAESDVPNALTAGRSPRNSVVVVTRGLIDRLEPQELEAVLAHELSHIAHHDALVMTVLGLPALAARRLLRWWVRTPLVVFVPFLFFAWVGYALATLALMSLSRYREYVADRGAAVLTGAPEQLMSALQKIAIGLPLIPDRDLRDAVGANAFFVLPATPKSDSLHVDPLRIFPTHPPLDRRLAALGELARNLGRRAPTDEHLETPPAEASNLFATASFFAAVAAWAMVGLLVLDLVQNRTVSVPPALVLLPPLVWAIGVFLGMQALGRAQVTGAGVAVSTVAVVLLLAPFGLAVLAAAGVTGAVLLLG